MAKAFNKIAAILKLMYKNNISHTMQMYPIPEEDWELKQGESETVIDAWKAVLNYDTHDVSIRYADANTGMVIVWDFNNVKDFDNIVYSLEFDYD